MPSLMCGTKEVQMVCHSAAWWGSFIVVCSVLGVGISGILIQDGCVMLVIDLLATDPASQSALETAELPVLALGKALAQCQAVKLLAHGSGLRTQVCARSLDTMHYTVPACWLRGLSSLFLTCNADCI
jgi:hypothetical protein